MAELSSAPDPQRTEQKPPRVEKRKHPVLRKTITITSTIGAGVFLIVLFIALPNLISFTPRFCAICHAQAHKAWLASTHKNVSCVQCHVESDLQSALLSRLSLGQKILWRLNPEAEHGKPGGFVGRPLDKSCDPCHKTRRVVSAAGDLRIPHTAHTQLRKLHCVDCHRYLVHGSSMRKGNRPSMIGCYRCHDGKKAPNSCSACHTEKALPDDHKSADWLKIHGQAQAANPDYCVECHGWVEDYCKECHQRKPRSHMTSDWRAHHQVLILSEDKRSGCRQCHGEMCVSCHPR